MMTQNVENDFARMADSLEVIANYYRRYGRLLDEIGLTDPYIINGIREMMKDSVKEAEEDRKREAANEMFNELRKNMHDDSEEV